MGFAKLYFIDPIERFQAMSETERRKSDFMFDQREFESTPCKLSEEPPGNLSGPVSLVTFFAGQRRVTPSERQHEIKAGVGCNPTEGKAPLKISTAHNLPAVHHPRCGLSEDPSEPPLC
jgi:hypothetical protein